MGLLDRGLITEWRLIERGLNIESFYGRQIEKGKGEMVEKSWAEREILLSPKIGR